jgi:transcriptional regulator with XRE-family HTH domain
VGTDKEIHFGRFVRWKRLDLDMSRDDLAAKSGLSGRHLATIESSAKPDVQDATYAALARGLGMTSTQLDEAWSSTPVSSRLPRKRKGKRTGAADELPGAIAQLFAGDPVAVKDLTEIARLDGVTPGQLLVRAWMELRNRRKNGYAPPAVNVERSDGVSERVTVAPGAKPPASPNRRAKGATPARPKARPRRQTPVPKNHAAP